LLAILYQSDASFDFGFVVNKDYLIYTSRREGAVCYASICSRTGLLVDVKEDELNELTQLSKQVNIKNNNTNITNDDIQTWITEQEYRNLQKQAMIANDLALKIVYLIIISCLLFVLFLIFIFLYIKTKRKYKAL
jgi:maltodextrin utilization protein YvdJ